MFLDLGQFRDLFLGKVVVYYPVYQLLTAGKDLMDQKHLPYNILLCITVAAVALMAVHNMALRSSGFSVLVDYSIPTSSDVHPEMIQQAAAAIEVEFPLELNAATQEELMLIPGIGEVLSHRIVTYREELGGFDDLSRLMEVEGVGEVTYQKIASYLYLSEE